MRPITTRWMDNGAWPCQQRGCTTAGLIPRSTPTRSSRAFFDIHAGETGGLVVIETQCNYFCLAGLSADCAKPVFALGWVVPACATGGIFGDGDTTAAKGHFVHVYRRSGTPAAPGRSRPVTGCSGDLVMTTAIINATAITSRMATRCLYRAAGAACRAGANSGSGQPRALG